MCAHTIWIIVINNKTLQIKFFYCWKKKRKMRKNECLKATEGTYDNKMFVLHNQELISCTFCKKSVINVIAFFIYYVELNHNYYCYCGVVAVL